MQTSSGFVDTSKLAELLDDDYGDARGTEVNE
jgi:hypothetical protein